MKSLLALQLIIILQMIASNSKSSLAEIEKNLLEQLTQVQDLSYPVIVSSELLKLSCLQPQQPLKNIMPSNTTDDLFYEDESDDFKTTQELDLVFSNDLKSRMDRIWNGPNKANYKHHLFARSFHNQKRCIKSLKNTNNQRYISLPESSSDWHQFSITNLRGQPENVQFNQDDLDSIKNGNINYPMILSYISILRAANIFPLNSYVFPLTFLQKLMGEAYGSFQYSQQKLCSYIETNLSSLEFEFSINLEDYDYLIFPAMIEKSYKCIIVQGANEVIQACKTNIILCNFRPDIGLIFSKAIKAYLILKMNQTRKVGKLNFKNKQIMAIYLMLPRQFNHIDSGIYLMLYLEFLFAKKGAQLQKLRMPENQKKLHLFPRSLALSSREHIWNLFVSLEVESSDKRRLEISKDFIDKRSRFCEGAVAELDYDQIDGRQLQKFLIMNNIRPNRNEHTLEYENELNYYLDPELNYYLSQSLS